MGKETKEKEKKGEKSKTEGKEQVEESEIEEVSGEEKPDTPYPSDVPGFPKGADTSTESENESQGSRESKYKRKKGSNHLSNAMKNLFKESNFPKTNKSEGMELFGEFTTGTFDTVELQSYGQGGAAYGGGYQPNKADELFIKSVNKIHFENLEDDFETYIAEMRANAATAGASNRIFKMTVYNNILGPVKTLIREMIPVKTKYLHLGADDYINALRLKISPVTERDLLRTKFLTRKQSANENIKFYSFDMINLYCRAYPESMRDMAFCFSRICKGLRNTHLKTYLHQHMMEVHNEHQLHVLLNKGLVHITRGVEMGVIPKHEAGDLGQRSITTSYRDVKDHVATVNSVQNQEREGTSEEERENVNFVSNKANPGTGKKGASSPNTNLTCWYCNKVGHLKHECLKRKKDLQGIVNRIGGEESDSSTSSEIEEVEKLMSVNAISRKTGRKVIQSLARARTGKVNQVEGEVKKESTLQQSLENIEARLNSLYTLEERVNALTDQMDSVNFLEKRNVQRAKK